MSKNTNTLAASDFASLLAAIVKNDTNTRKAINLAFHASMRDLFNSKSAERLNQFTATVSGMAYWGKVKKAIITFSGGTEIELGAKPARYYNAEKSVIRFGKMKTWEILPMDKGTWEENARAYNAIAKVDYDCLEAKARPSDGLDLSQLRSAALKLHANQDKWNPKERRAINDVLHALSGVLSGFQVNIDTDQTLLKQNSDITGKPAEQSE
jgi:hypothetical protein